MKNNVKQAVCISLLLLPTSGYAWKWIDLWQTPDQQGARLLQAGRAQEAAQTFDNQAWRAVSLYRSGKYAQAFQHFGTKKTSDDQYNAGNAAAYMGDYQAAIDAYDKAIALNPNNSDAIANREIIKKLKDKKHSQSNSSVDHKNDKNKNTKDKGNSHSSSPQDMQQNNSSQNNTSENKKSKNQQQKGIGENQKNQAGNLSQKQGDNSSQTQNGQKSDSEQQKEEAVTANSAQTQDEEKNQLLRRLVEDPGGLLRQKFLRDYFRRHAPGENQYQGEN